MVSTVTVAPRRSASRARPVGESRSAVETATAAPFASAPHTSKAEASKVTGEWNSTRSRGVIVTYSGRWARPAMPRWVTATPLGRPVEPEVNITYATASGSYSANGVASPACSDPAGGSSARSPGMPAASVRSLLPTVRTAPAVSSMVAMRGGG